MQINKIIFLLFVISVTFELSIFASEFERYGDVENFSERSLIMKLLNNQNEISQEQKDVLSSKKLYLSPACLFEQIKKNNIDNVRTLLEFKLDPNKSYLSDYPLYYAAKLNRTEIAKLLIEYGAKPDRGFYSELYEAVKNKNYELSQILIDKKAKVNYQDSITNNSILYLAIKNNMLDITQQLILKGAYPDKKSVKIIKKKKLYKLIPDK